MIHKIKRLLVVSAMLVVGGACGQDEENPEPLQLDPSGLDPLQIEEEYGPFAFCVDEPGVNLTNAAGLAYLSADVYAHYYHVGPILGDLGFGNPGEGQAWKDCAEALLWLQDVEQTNSIPVDHQLWPRACARRWWEQRLEAGGMQPASHAAAFEQYLLQTVLPEARIQFFSEGQFADEDTVFEVGSTQVMWIEHQTLPLVIIAFRGTEPDKWGDIAADLDVFKEPFSTRDVAWGEVHSGFLEALESVIDLLSARAEPLLQAPGNTRVWITGHSLGGALATVMTAWVMERRETDSAWQSFPLAGVATFGSPRVGNATFAEKFAQSLQMHQVNMMRFVNADDLVTRVPAIGYDHVGDTFYLGEEDDDACPTDDPCFVILEGDSGGAYLGSVGDHNIVNYYDRILAQIDVPENAAYLECP